MTYDNTEPLEVIVIEMRNAVCNTLAQESLNMSALILQRMKFLVLPGTSHQRPGE
jgi:hypothetical protein